MHKTKGNVLGKAQFLWWVFLKDLVMKEKKEVSREIKGPKKNFKIKQSTNPSLFLSKVTIQKKFLFSIPTEEDTLKLRNPV